MAGLFQGLADAVVGQGDLRPHDMNVGTRSRPSASDGRLTDYGYHLKKWEREMQRGRDTSAMIQQEYKLQVAEAGKTYNRATGEVQPTGTDIDAKKFWREFLDGSPSRQDILNKRIDEATA